MSSVPPSREMDLSVVTTVCFRGDRVGDEAGDRAGDRARDIYRRSKSTSEPSKRSRPLPMRRCHSYDPSYCTVVKSGTPDSRPHHPLSTGADNAHSTALSVLSTILSSVRVTVENPPSTFIVTEENFYPTPMDKL